MLDNEEMICEMLGILEMLLGISAGNQHNLLLYLIEDAVELVKGYCKIDDIPEGLAKIIPQIAADVYRANGYGQTDAPEDIKSISEGEQTISFESRRPDTESILQNYYKRLDPYRSRRGRVPSEIG